MESKTKHRILGIAVVAGLAVLMYPFISGNGNLPNERVLVKAPGFPDQATQVTSESGEDVVGMPANEPVAANAQQPEPDVLTQQPEGDAKPSPNVANISGSPADAQKATAEIPAAQPDENVPAKAVVKTNEEGHVTSRLVDNKAAKIKSLQKKISAKSIKKYANAKIHSRIEHQKSLSARNNRPLDNNGLMELKKSAYVIQLGSFKQKTNALRLVNKLRAKGYRAFIQSVDASSGENTRVFVGPEHQQASARIVAAQLEKDMKLRGIVLSYKPFTL